MKNPLKIRGEKPMKNNIILVGFMGCGKTSVGESLANKMSFNFVDTDQVIESVQKTSIPKIFEEYGEAYFRELETNTIQRMLVEVDDSVISTGGGLPIREENAQILNKLGFVVYLKVSGDTVVSRLKGDTSRPLLSGDNVKKKVNDLLAVRSPIYEKIADMVVITDSKTILDIMHEILQRFEADRCNNE